MCTMPRKDTSWLRRLKTTILDEAAVSEIEARRARCLDNKNQSRLAEASILIASDIPALCATVKHLRAEVAEYERTDLVPRSRYNVADAEAREAREQTKQLAHRAGEEIESLQSQLEQLRAENEALRSRVLELETEIDTKGGYL